MRSTGLPRWGLDKELTNLFRKNTPVTETATEEINATGCDGHLESLEPFRSWPRTDRGDNPLLPPYMPDGVHGHERVTSFDDLSEFCFFSHFGFHPLCPILQQVMLVLSEIYFVIVISFYGSPSG